MESRKITIISTKVNKKIVINSDATTLGELKRDLRAAGVDYDGMTFYEGLTKTELKLDESLLPHDVQRINPTTKEPETTNELAFMLTNTNKKIKSGASMSRADVYAAIKAKGLQNECVRVFGKNFTMCKTADLISLVESQSVSKLTTSKSTAPKAKTSSASSTPITFVDVQARAAIRKLVHLLFELDIIENYEDVEVICPILEEENTLNSPYSDDELDAMFNNMTR